MAKEEDAFWETGKCSGTMYCGDHEHYDFMNEAFGLFAHVNVLQRDMCPSATKFEGEIIAMALDLFHADAVTDSEPAGLVTTGGTGSILHAVLAYREQAAATRGVTRPNFVKPETAPPGVRQGLPPVRHRAAHGPDRPRHDARSTWRPWPSCIDDQTIAVIGSACNYGYGTIDPIAELGDLALEPGRRPARRRLPRRVHPPVRRGARLRHPHLRLPGPRRHQHLGRHPQVRLRLQGQLDAAVPRQGAAQRPVLLPHRAGPAASTCRPASRAHARAGCSPPRGRRWCSSAATATGATPSRSSRPRPR